MLISAAFIFLLTIIVASGVFLIQKSDITFQEKRQSITILVVIFLIVLSLNELQNFNLKKQHQLREINQLSDYFAEYDNNLEEIESDVGQISLTAIEKLFGQNIITNPPLGFYLVSSSESEINETRNFFSKISKYAQTLQISSVHMYLSDSSPLFWDRIKAQEIFLQAAEYTQKIYTEKNTTSLIIIEYEADESLLLGQITNKKAPSIVESFMQAYLNGQVTLIIYGRSQIIESLQKFNEDYYWFSKSLKFSSIE